MLHALRRKTGESLWTFGTRAKIDSSPVIAGRNAYFGSTSGTLYAVNLDTGQSAWEFDTGAGIASSPAIAKSRLVIGNDDGVLFCFGRK